LGRGFTGKKGEIGRICTINRRGGLSTSDKSGNMTRAGFGRGNGGDPNAILVGEKKEREGVKRGKGKHLEGVASPVSARKNVRE